MTEQEQLAEIKALIQQTNQRLDNLEHKTDTLTNQVKEFEIRIDTYQKASQQVVNIAFSLILAATAAIVIPAVLAR